MKSPLRTLWGLMAPIIYMFTHVYQHIHLFAFQIWTLIPLFNLPTLRTYLACVFLQINRNYLSSLGWNQWIAKIRDLSVCDKQKWLNGVSTESMQHELYSLKHSSLCSNNVWHQATDHHLWCLLGDNYHINNSFIETDSISCNSQSIMTKDP